MTAINATLTGLRSRNSHKVSRVEVFLGTGPGTQYVGYLESAYPDGTPDPATVALLPVGRRFLTAATETDFYAALDTLAEAWSMCGFGPAVSGCNHDLATWKTWRRRNLHVGGAYTFDGRRVLYLPDVVRGIDNVENDWHSITLHSERPPACRGTTLAGRAREAFDRARRQDPGSDVGRDPAYLKRAALRRTLGRDVAEEFGVARTAVTVTDDPDRQHGGWHWFLVTIADGGTEYRLTCCNGTVDDLRVLGPCPECGGEVPLLAANDPAALGRYLDARATGTSVPCPPGLTFGVGHTPGCPVREDL
ncbi:hypothetical protein NQK81_21950 [Amycolatopsis roodepoortensis]|uniref:hypothetical protein n=1 Tax=Amycolatopsis roodepoortensis TaxID=700274 RepID=UPI00214C6710|nr:hypothetical protein [Amycolatopsis roodepoortensis]UUV35986.1 hypothetical protein NQK81_21950 [Amycolatopsis roodepoortensis]